MSEKTPTRARTRTNSKRRRIYSDESSDDSDIPKAKQRTKEPRKRKTRKNTDDYDDLFQLKKPKTLKKDSIEKWPASTFLEEIEFDDGYPKCIYITAKEFLEYEQIREFLEKSRELIESSVLSYSSAYFAFLTSKMASVALDKLTRLKIEIPSLLSASITLIDQTQITDTIAHRRTQTQRIFSANEMKCLVVRGIKPNPHKLPRFLKPFDIENFEIRENELWTWHKRASSVDDFMLAFDNGHAGFPNAFVTEEANTLDLRSEVFEIVKSRLITCALQDCQDILSASLYRSAIRIVRAEALAETYKKQDVYPVSQKRCRPLNMYVSTMPINWFLSESSGDIISHKVKRETRRKKREKMLTSQTGVNEDVPQEPLGIDLEFDAIKQPQIENGSSRLTPVHEVKEWHRRSYLIPYANARRRRYVLAREAGTTMYHSQFMNPLEKSGTHGGRGVLGKRVYFEKSAIQGYGMFALEPIDAGEFICEYHGQIIRMEVADNRERISALRGFEHTYMFRLGEAVIDATEHGATARFLNCSCNPNCRAEEIKIQKINTVSFFAIKRINPHDEIVFDFNMQLEEDPAKWLRCYCGSKNCNGFLNWSIYPEVLASRKRKEAFGCDDDDFVNLKL